MLNGESLITLNKKVELLPYKARPLIERELLTDSELLKFVGNDAYVDLETYPNYFLASFKIKNKFLCLECGEDKKFNPQLLSWMMFNYRTIGFNSINFDNLLIWLAYHYQNAALLKDAANAIILRGIREWELKKEFKFQTFKTSIIDLLDVAPLKGSLKLYMARLHAPRIQELPFPDDKELTEEEKEIVKYYNFNDLDGTELLCNFMKERLELRASMSLEYNEDLMSKSDAQIAEVVLAKEIAKLNGKYPKRQDVESGTVFKYSIPNYINYQQDNLNSLLGKIRTAKFIVQPSGKIALPDELQVSVQIGEGIYRLGIGGLHSSEKTVAYKSTEEISIVDRDVQSYYPRLITTLQLYPQSCGPNFLVAFEKLIKIRLDAKERKIFSRDKGLKIVINGTSGKLSDVWSIFYSPDLTIQMTVTGQLALLMFIAMLEMAGIKVISANTDGIVMLVGKEQEQAYEQVWKYWEQLTGFTTEETRYSGYYARDVNAYFAVKLDGSVKVKGNPYSEVGSQSGTQLDVNPSVLICADAVKALLSKNIPIEETILNCKDFTRFVNVRQAKSPGAHKNGEYLGKVLRWYHTKGELGAIHTVAANNKVADSDGAKPCLDMPESFPEDVDHQWYINKTREILMEIGYLVQPKQLQFF